MGGSTAGTPAPSLATPPAPARRRFATRRSKIVLGSFLLLIPGLSYTTIELTSVPGFCRSCHEIEPAYASWSRSPHAPAKGKQRASCRDCHVPSWREPWAVVWVKLTHGFGDTYHHLAGHARPSDPGFYFELKEKTLRDVPDKICLGCHADIRRPAKDVIKTKEAGVIRGLHTSEEALKLRCIVCHRNTGHDIYD